jgi:hypothetical protein
MNNQPPKMTTREKLSLTFLLIFLTVSIINLFRVDPMASYNEAKLAELEKQYAQKLQQDVALQKEIYTLKLDSLQCINDSLSFEVKQTHTQLIASRGKNVSLKNQLISTINSYDSDTTLVKDQQAFDSLAGVSIKYVDQAEITDSLCQLEISLLKEQMENRDTTISICNTQVELLEQDFFLLSKSHERLTEQLAFTEKKLKRQIVKKRLFQGAALLVSGVCISFYLTHH